MSPDTARFLALLPAYREHSDWRQISEGVTEKYLPEHNHRYFVFHGRPLHMNYSLSIFLINDDVRALYVVYQLDEKKNENQQRYLVKTMDKDIKEGDYVVVAAALPGNLSVARVKAVDVEVDFESATGVPWVVQRINMTAFNELVEQEEAAITVIRRANFQERRRKLADSLLSAKTVRQLPLSNRKEENNR